MSGWAAAGQFAGELIGGIGQYHGNRKLAQQNREWQEYMDNTKYQRAADDLEAAGLNRILALGSPGSTPSGAQASISKPDFGGAVQTGINAASAKQAIELSKAEEKLISQKENESRATEALAITNAMSAQTQADLNKANEYLSRETARLRSAEATKEERFTPIYDKIGSGVEGLVRFLENKFTSSAKDAQDDKPGIFGRGIEALRNAIESKMRDADEWYKRRIPINKRGE